MDRADDQQSAQGPKVTVREVRLSPEKKQFASMHIGGDVRFWDLATGALVH
jgi:hypothetical protein